MARYRPDAFSSCRPWQDIVPMRSRAAGHGKIVPRCVPEGASDGGKHRFAATYRRHVSEKPRRAPLGNAPREHLAAKGRFRRPKPPNHARRTNLAALRWPCPCAGAPARAAASRDRLSTAWPLLRGACPRRPADTRHLPCPSQSETSRRWASAAIIRRMACSSAKPQEAADCIISTGRPTTECCAELGLNSKTVNKWAQKRRRRPQARPGLRQRCQKRPSKGRIPLDGTIGTPHPFPIAQKS